MRRQYAGVYSMVLLIVGLALGPRLGNAEVSMEAHLGIQGAVRLGRWNQVTVVLHNPGAAWTGVLEVHTWRDSQESRGDVSNPSFTRAVELPHGARKRFTFVVPIVSTTYPVEVMLRTPEAVLLRQQLDLRQALHTEHLVLGLTQDFGLDALTTAFQTSMPIRVAYLAPADLPSVWYGYDSVSAMVVKGVSLQTLSTEQATALQQWLARGGTLVIAGDAQYALLQEPRLRALLPVHVVGVQPLLAPSAFAERYGVPVPAIPSMVVQARLSSGEILVGDPANTLLAQRPFGRGRVVFLAVDYAMQPWLDWQGSPALWKDILRFADNVDYSQTFAELGLTDESHPMLKLLQRQILAYPSHLALTVFLGGYCACLAVLFWRLGKRRARYRRLWLAIVLVVGGFSVWATTVFPERHLRQPGLCFDLTVMEALPGTEYSQTQGYLGLFSATGGTFALTLQTPPTIVRHTFSRGAGKASPEFEVSTTSPMQLRHLVLAPWSLRLLRTESMTPTVLQVQAQRHATGLSVHLYNAGNVPLDNALGLYRGTLFPLGVLRPGETLLENLFPTLPAPDTSQDIVWRLLHKRSVLRTAEAGAEYFQEGLLQQYFGDKRLGEMSDAANSTLLIIGWLQRPGTVAPAAPAVPTWGMTLVVSRLTL